MKHLDANVLIAWHRADHPHHPVVTSWAETLIASGEPFTAHDLAWTAFVRISSNRRIFPVPTPIPDAFAFRRSVVAQHRYLPIEVDVARWQRVEELCSSVTVSANLVNDAIIASAAMNDGAALVSMDGDFGRFRRLDWIDPRDP